MLSPRCAYTPRHPPYSGRGRSLGGMAAPPGLLPRKVCPVSWVRRTVAAVLVAALVVLIPAGNETPASAAQLPAPVDPSQVLPSTAQRVASGSSTSAMKVIGGATEAYKMAGSSLTVPGSIAPKVPITSPGAVPKLSPVVAGGPASAALSGWFAIGGAGAAVSFVGQVTGTDFDSAMCGADSWVQTGYGWLTMGMGPSCKAPVVQPNVDVVPGVGPLTWGSFSLVRSGTYSTGSGGGYCWIRTGDFPSGWYSLSPDGVSYSSPTSVGSGSSTAVKTGCGWVAGETTKHWSRNPSYVVITNATHPDGAGRVVASAPVLGADPLRDSVCTLTWKDGSTTTGFVGQYRESEGFPIGVVDHACTEAFVSKPGAGPDLLPDRISIGSTNTETGAKTEIAGQDVPDFTESERKGLNVGNGTGLVLRKVAGLDAGSCMTWAADCAGWWETSSSGTDESSYRCEFGGAPVDLAECGIYRRTFDTKTDTPTVTDPDTGEQTRWTNTTDPANSYGTGAQSNQSNNACVTSFSLNPVDWVLRPLRCAFEPRQSKIDQAKARLNAAWTGSGIGGSLLALGGLLDAFNSNVGCGGLPFHLEAFGTTLVDTRLLAACEEPARGIAATVRTVLTVGIIGGGILATIRYLGALFGFAAFGRVNNGANSGKSGVHFE